MDPVRARHDRLQGREVKGNLPIVSGTRVRHEPGSLLEAPLPGEGRQNFIERKESRLGPHLDAEVTDGEPIGDAQLRWLMNQLSLASDAPLVIWVNTVPWIASPSSGSDNWGSYAHEREAIANHIDRLGLARRLLMLSGDAHMVAIDDGTH